MKFFAFLIFILLTQPAFSNTCDTKLMELLLGVDTSSVKAGKDTDVTGSISPIADVEEHLVQRVKDGEFTSEEVAAFLGAVGKIDPITGNQLFGDDVVKCMSNFSDNAVRQLMYLVNKLQLEKDSDNLFKKLMSISRERYNDSQEIARKRICMLSGVGNQNSCKVFGEFFAKQCK